jgi:hypothetical protein
MSASVEFIQAVDLPAAPRVMRDADVAAIASSFSADKQALAVNAQLTEFQKNVPQNIRSTISYGLLLGQLAADKELAGDTDPLKWFNSFNGVMRKIGWLRGGSEFANQQIADVNVELHKALIPVLEAALGPAAAAASVILATLKGLQDMNKDSPWITLFQRKSATTQGAKMGLSFVDAGDGGGALIKTAFFGFEARQMITQVLFFKIAISNATVRTASSSLEISAQTLADTKDALAAKVKPFVAENIANIAI